MASFPIVPYPRLRRRPSDDPYEGDAWAAADEPTAPPVRRAFTGEDPYETTPESEAIERGRDVARRGVADTVISRMRLPADTINAEDAPAPTRLRSPNPDFVGTYDRTSRMDPETQRASMIRQGLSPAEYEAMHSPMRKAPVLQERDEHPKRGGVLGTLKNIGKGALLGFSMGGANGMGAGIGGAMAGAVFGGASPKMLENTDYAVRRRPQFEKENESYNKELGQREVLADRIGSRTGFDPISGVETPGHEDRRESRQIRRLQMESMSEDREAAEEGRAQGRANTAYQTWLMHGDPSKPLTKAEATRMNRPELAGQTPPPRAYAPKNPQIQPTAQGIMKVNPDGSTSPLLAPDGKTQLTAIDAGAPGRAQSASQFATRLTREDQDKAEARQEKARTAVGDFDKAKKEAERSDSEYRETLNAYNKQRASGTVKGEHVIGADKLSELQAKADAARQAMLDAHRTIQENYSDQYEAGVQDETSTDNAGNRVVLKQHPYVKSKTETGVRGKGSTGANKVPVLSSANAAVAAQRRGMTPEAFAQWFESQGGVIQP